MFSIHLHFNVYSMIDNLPEKLCHVSYLFLRKSILILFLLPKITYSEASSFFWTMTQKGQLLLQRPKPPRHSSSLDVFRKLPWWAQWRSPGSCQWSEVRWNQTASKEGEAKVPVMIGGQIKRSSLLVWSWLMSLLCHFSSDTITIERSDDYTFSIGGIIIF